MPHIASAHQQAQELAGAARARPKLLHDPAGQSGAAGVRGPARCSGRCGLARHGDGPVCRAGGEVSLPAIRVEGEWQPVQMSSTSVAPRAVGTEHPSHDRRSVRIQIRKAVVTC